MVWTIWITVFAWELRQAWGQRALYDLRLLDGGLPGSMAKGDVVRCNACGGGEVAEACSKALVLCRIIHLLESVWGQEASMSSPPFDGGQTSNERLDKPSATNLGESCNEFGEPMPAL